MSDPVPVGTMPDGSPILEVRLEGEGLAVAVLSLGAALPGYDFQGRRWCSDATTPTTTWRRPRISARSSGASPTASRRALQPRRHGLRAAPQRGGPRPFHGGTRGFSRRNWDLHGGRRARGDPDLPGGRWRGGLSGGAHRHLHLRHHRPRHSAHHADGDDGRRYPRQPQEPQLLHLLLPPDGGPAPTIDDHVIEIPADAYLPVDDGLIPTGAVAPVAGTRFDLRAPTRIGTQDFDHAFVLGRETVPEPRPVAGSRRRAATSR